jgi:hypothetical protein
MIGLIASIILFNLVAFKTNKMIKKRISFTYGYLLSLLTPLRIFT